MLTVKVYSYLCLSVALILLSISTTTLTKIFKGSKSSFAYILLTFTFLYGLEYLACYLEQEFTKTIEYDGVPIQVINLNARSIIDYFLYVLSIQNWIFAIKYLDSAI